MPGPSVQRMSKGVPTQVIASFEGGGPPHARIGPPVAQGNARPSRHRCLQNGTPCVPFRSFAGAIERDGNRVCGKCCSGGGARGSC
jgi:hypothetical protein